MSEYLRRNLNVAKAVGANANAKAALLRLSATKRPQKWMTAALQGIIHRTEPLGVELAVYRDLAEDRPTFQRGLAPASTVKCFPCRHCGAIVRLESDTPFTVRSWECRCGVWNECDEATEQQSQQQDKP